MHAPVLPYAWERLRVSAGSPILMPLIERLWAWRDEATMAALAEAFKARGMPWLGVANALAAEHGTRMRTEVRHPAWARLPAFGVA